MNFVFVLLAILFGQYIHIYFKWMEFKKNQVEEKEDHFLYYLNLNLGEIGARSVLLLAAALWIGLTSAGATFAERFGDYVWPFYAFVGYSIDSLIKNIFAKFSKEEVGP